MRVRITWLGPDDRKHTEVVSVPNIDKHLSFASIPLYLPGSKIAKVSNLLEHLPNHYLFEDDSGLFAIRADRIVDCQPAN